MNVVLWIIASVLALAFLAAGLMKLTQPREKVIANGARWAEDFSGSTVKLIGACEALAAIGLILPAAIGIVPILAPLAALGLVLIMAGAAITHVRRKEAQMVVVTLILLALAATVAWGRFGPYPFAS